MSQLGRMDKFILVGAGILSAVIGGYMGYEQYHTTGAALLFGAVGPTAIFFAALRAYGDV